MRGYGSSTTRPGSQQPDRLTIEQVRSAINASLSAADLKPAARRKRHEKDENKQRYHQRRNRQVRKVPHQNENRPIDRDGHRRQPDQIMYNLTGSPLTYAVSRLGFTATRFAKVALPN